MPAHAATKTNVDRASRAGRTFGMSPPTPAHDIRFPASVRGASAHRSRSKQFVRVFPRSNRRVSSAHRIATVRACGRSRACVTVPAGTPGSTPSARSTPLMWTRDQGVPRSNTVMPGLLRGVPLLVGRAIVLCQQGSPERSATLSIVSGGGQTSPLERWSARVPCGDLRRVRRPGDRALRPAQRPTGLLQRVLRQGPSRRCRCRLRLTRTLRDPLARSRLGRRSASRFVRARLGRPRGGPIGPVRGAGARHQWA